MLIGYTIKSEIEFAAPNEIRNFLSLVPCPLSLWSPVPLYESFFIACHQRSGSSSLVAVW